MSTTTTDTSTDDPGPLAERRRDRRRFGALIGAAMLAFVTLDLVGYPLVAVGAYWTFVAGAAVLLRSSDAMMDERDRALERTASHRTMVALAVALIVLGPGVDALAEANVYDVPSLVDGVLFGWVAVFVLWAVAYAWTRLHR